MKISHVEMIELPSIHSPCFTGIQKDRRYHRSIDLHFFLITVLIPQCSHRVESSLLKTELIFAILQLPSKSITVWERVLPGQLNRFTASSPSGQFPSLGNTVS